MNEPVYLNRGEKQISIDKLYERWFCEDSGATPSESKAEDYAHIDCYLGETPVDVKSLKPIVVKRRLILIELINNYGNSGWCGRDSKAKKIAFALPDFWLLVTKENIRKFLLLRIDREEFVQFSKKYRKSEDRNFKNKDASKCVYKPLGRNNTQDLYTYVRVDDLLNIPHERYEYKTPLKTRLSQER